MDVVGLDAAIRTDVSKPDGTPRKLLSVDRMHAMGWKHTTMLKDGIAKTYAAFLATERGSSD
jgi:GDP-L-fucose synthase